MRGLFHRCKMGRHAAASVNSSSCEPLQHPPILTCKDASELNSCNHALNKKSWKQSIYAHIFYSRCLIQVLLAFWGEDIASKMIFCATPQSYNPHPNWFVALVDSIDSLKSCSLAVQGSPKLFPRLCWKACVQALNSCQHLTQSWWSLKSYIAIVGWDRILQSNGWLVVYYLNPQLEMHRHIQVCQKNWYC